MRIACPNCESIYELPAEVAARLPASLRCVRCGTTWEVTAPPSTSTKAAAPEAASKSAQVPPVPPKKPEVVASSPPPVTGGEGPAAAKVDSPPKVEKAKTKADDAASLELPKPPANTKAAAGASTAAKATSEADMAAGKRAAGIAALELVLAAPSVPEPSAAATGSDDAADEAAEEAPLPVATARTQWVISILVLAAAIILILVLHKPIGHAWPPIMRLYHAIGLG